MRSNKSIDLKYLLLHPQKGRLSTSLILLLLKGPFNLIKIGYFHLKRMSGQYRLIKAPANLTIDSLIVLKNLILLRMRAEIIRR